MGFFQRLFYMCLHVLYKIFTISTIYLHIYITLFTVSTISTVGQQYQYTVGHQMRGYMEENLILLLKRHRLRSTELDHISVLLLAPFSHLNSS